MAFQFPWTNLHELNLDWFLSKFKQFTNNYLGTTATVELIPDTEQPEVTVTGGTLDDDTDIVDPFTFNFKLPFSQGGAVDSVNGQTGTVVLDKSDIGLGNVDNVQQYSATNPPPYPVTSVNGDTGAVVLDKTDIGLGNVANVAQYSATNPPPYPVTSVNGQTGDVTISPATDAQVTTAVNTWLGNNVAQETGYVLDRSLTMSNAASPADLVGDLKSGIGDIENGYVAVELVPDTYISGTGVEMHYAGWSSSDYIPITDDIITVVATERSTYNSFYDENKSFISGENFAVEVGTTIIQVPSNAKYFRLSNTSSAMANEKVYSTINVRLSSLETVIKDKDAETKQNYYENQTLISGRVYNGVYSDTITTLHCTDFLPISPGRTYAVYGGFLNQNYSNYYDKDKVYKGSLPLGGLNNQYPYNESNNFLLFTAPSDAEYTRINFFNTSLVDGTDMRPEWYFRDVTNLVWAKKKMLVISDSISTDVYGNYKKWVTDLQDEGFISNGLVKNKSQHATGFVATYSGDATTTFINRLTAVGDLTGFDAIITFGGINDWIQNIDFDTFKTAVDTYFDYLIENATQARIIVFSPLHTALYGTTNSAGKTQKDYDDYIKSVAKDYAFPCLNLTDESGFCPDKSTTFKDMWTLLPAGFSEHDGVHPIEAWEKDFLAPMIKGFLETL